MEEVGEKGLGGKEKRGSVKGGEEGTI